MPVSTIVLTSVGMPLVYSGQEVGWGFGISDFDQRRRGVIDWNYTGKSTLQPHYQKLAQIRSQFAPFWTQKQIQFNTSNSSILGYTRPLNDLNGIILANFDGNAHSAIVPLSASTTPNVYFAHGVVNGKTYYATDLYNDTVYSMTFSSGTASFSVNLPAFGSAVLVLDDTTHSVVLPPITGISKGPATAPGEFALRQNYPNPFNPTTTIEYDVPRTSVVTIRVFDVLGRQVSTLVNSERQPGHYVATWDGSDFASGVYFCQLSAGSLRIMKKMLLLR